MLPLCMTFFRVADINEDGLHVAQTNPHQLGVTGIRRKEGRERERGRGRWHRDATRLDHACMNSIGAPQRTTYFGYLEARHLYSLLMLASL